LCSIIAGELRPENDETGSGGADDAIGERTDADNDGAAPGGWALQGRMNRGKPKILVVGAGIVATAIAYRLARRGADVVIVEQNCPAGGVTGKSFAWINAAHGVAPPNVPLRIRALAEYRQLQGELGDALRIDWNGALTWTNDRTPPS
jgi:NADPH-dependent 2,4-dienoyl-CoA reductase/sulfur reductase-like enzyme